MGNPVIKLRAWESDLQWEIYGKGPTERGLQKENYRKRTTERDLRKEAYGERSTEYNLQRFMKNVLQPDKLENVSSFSSSCTEDATSHAASLLPRLLAENLP